MSLLTYFESLPGYAGLLPISDKPDASELYFWFFPSTNPLAKDGTYSSDVTYHYCTFQSSDGQG
jgi:hypothetical protein